jgi:hypothetical protein
MNHDKREGQDFEEGTHFLFNHKMELMSSGKEPTQSFYVCVSHNAGSQ